MNSQASLVVFSNSEKLFEDLYLYPNISDIDPVLPIKISTSLIIFETKSKASFSFHKFLLKFKSNTIFTLFDFAILTDLRTLS